MLTIKVVSCTLATITLSSFLVCASYGLATLQSLHMHDFLDQVLPGLKWLTWQGFLIGVIESFLYGVFAGMIYVLLHNFFHRHWNNGWAMKRLNPGMNVQGNHRYAAVKFFFGFRSVWPWRHQSSV